MNDEPTNELPWVEKYRPQDLENVVSQKDITQTLQTFIQKVCAFFCLVIGFF